MGVLTWREGGSRLLGSVILEAFNLILLYVTVDMWLKQTGFRNSLIHTAAWNQFIDIKWMVEVRKWLCLCRTGGDCGNVIYLNLHPTPLTNYFPTTIQPFLLQGKSKHEMSLHIEGLCSRNAGIQVTSRDEHSVPSTLVTLVYDRRGSSSLHNLSAHACASHRHRNVNTTTAWSVLRVTTKVKNQGDFLYAPLCSVNQTWKSPV